MKKISPKSITIFGQCIILISTMLQSCSTVNKIYSENDVVYSTKRFELRYYVRDRDRRSPLFFFTQSLVKEIDSKNEVSVTAFDVLSLSASSFKLDEKAFLIIDNVPYPMIIDKIEHENVRSISEDSSEISTSDSTTISVITGFSENNRKITRFSYKIPFNTLVKMKGSKQLLLRYYSGPSMITVKPKRKSINKIQRLIDIA